MRFDAIRAYARALTDEQRVKLARLILGDLLSDGLRQFAHEVDAEAFIRQAHERLISAEGEMS